MQAVKWTVEGMVKGAQAVPFLEWGQSEVAGGVFAEYSMT